jgi:hypothetical protein
MLNTLLASPVAATALVIAVLVYLASCIPPLILSLRSYLDFALVGPRAGFNWNRFLMLTSLIIAIPLSLAWHDPGLSETAFALTGATGVCLVCYIIPVIAHFRLMFARADAPLQVSSDDAALVDVLNTVPRLNPGELSAGQYLGPPVSPRQWLLHVVRPLGVVTLGVVLSGMAVWQAATSCSSQA